MDRGADFRNKAIRPPSFIACPALIVKIAMSTLMSREQVQRMLSTAAQGELRGNRIRLHHIMLDNPDGLIAVLKNFRRNAAPGNGVLRALVIPV